MENKVNKVYYLAAFNAHYINSAKRLLDLLGDQIYSISKEEAVVLLAEFLEDRKDTGLPTYQIMNALEPVTFSKNSSKEELLK
ncbi:MAG TPA: hypothetical protein VI819_00275 [Patescibacteria group bacterium]|nr:hypothetical protein [Patescibacteria group bacterium]